MNRYAFERDAPYGHSDPDGHFLQYLIPGAIGGIINTINYFSSHNSPSLGGAAGYFAAGFATGEGALGGLPGVIGGAVAGKVIERVTDNQPLSTSDAYADYATTAVVAGATYGLGTLLPQPKTWLIKNAGSYFTTGTGQQFIAYQFVENSFSQLLTYLASQGVLHNVQQTANGVGAQQQTTSTGVSSDTPTFLSNGGRGRDPTIVGPRTSGPGLDLAPRGGLPTPPSPPPPPPLDLAPGR